MNIMKKVTGLILLIICISLNAQGSSGNTEYVNCNPDTISGELEKGSWTENMNLSHKWVIGIGPSGPPPYEYGFYLGLDKFQFSTYPNIYTLLQVRYDGGNWEDVNENNYLTPEVIPPWTSLGTHTLDIRYWLQQSGELVSRSFIIYVIPPRTRLFYDGTGNYFDLWQGGSNSTDRPLIIVEGFDAVNYNNPAYYYAKATNFFDDLRDLQVDVIILNLEDGGDDIATNAETVKSIVNYVNTLISGNTQPILGGLSMGGVVSRYALAEAEDDNDPLNVSHFLSIDAPQQDAVIDQIFQNYINYKMYPDKHPALNSMAAKQMLRFSTYDPDGTIHTNFYNQLNSLNGDGYPHLTKNIGVSFSPNIENPHDGKWLTVDVEGFSTMEFFINNGDPWKEAGSYLPLSSTYAAGYGSIIWGWGSVFWSLVRHKHPTFIPHKSALDIVSGTSKFEVRIHSSVHNFHDNFPNDVINPIIAELNLQTNSIVSVNFKNKIIDENDAGGSLQVINSDNQIFNISSNSNLDLLNNELHSVETMEPKRNNFYNNNVDYQHNYWNVMTIPKKYKLKESFWGWENNHHQNAFFVQLRNVTINTNYQSSTISGNIEFKDPWFQENDGTQPGNFHSYGSPFTPGIGNYADYGGVFLNEGEDPFNPTPPYYTIRIPQEDVVSINGENVSYFFQQWSVNNAQLSSPDNIIGNYYQTPVIFNAPGATVNATYKGHLLSENSAATASNSSRKIATDGDGNLYMVYEDNGDIYYSYSTNNGSTWSVETKINTESYQCSNPALTVANAGNSEPIIYVVWAEFFYDNLWNIKYRRRSHLGVWDAEQTIAEWYYEGLVPVPAIAHSHVSSYPEVYVFYHCIQFDQNQQPKTYPEIIGWKKDDDYDGNSSWNNIFTLENALNPSLSHSEAGSNGNIGIVWEKNNQIYFKETNARGDWSATKQISENLWYLINQQKPSISFTADIAHITWTVYNQMSEMNETYYRYYNSDENKFGQITTLPSGGDDTGNPSISTKITGSTAAYDYAIYYQMIGEGEIRKVSKINGQYFDENLGSGKYPNTLDHGMNSAIWTKYNSAPYFIEHYYDDDSGEEEILIEMKRFDFVYDSTENGGQKGNLTLDLIQLSVENNSLELRDSLISENISLQNNNFEFQYALIINAHQISASLNKTKSILNFRFKDGNNSYSLNSLKLNDVLNPDGTAKSNNSTHSINILNLPGNLGQIEVLFNNKKPIVSTILLDNAGYRNYLAKGGINENSIFTPKEYALWQNYPNPFNPVTTVQFDIPEAGRTRLEVFDIRGRLVSTLVDDNLNSGRYSFTFDGSKLSSGLYFYILNSKPDNSSKKIFREVKKMMLVK